MVLALETARGVSGIPPRFHGMDTICQGTNLRRQYKNSVQARALLDACAALGRTRCRVLDLFSPTLPWIADPCVYKSGDPVHFRMLGVHWMKRLLTDVLLSMNQPRTLTQFT